MGVMCGSRVLMRGDDMIASVRLIPSSRVGCYNCVAPSLLMRSAVLLLLVSVSYECYGARIERWSDVRGAGGDADERFDGGWRGRGVVLSRTMEACKAVTRFRNLDVWYD